LAALLRIITAANGGEYTSMADIRSGASQPGSATVDGEVDLLISGADLVVTMDEALEIPGGWVAIRDGRIAAVGTAGTEPPTRRVIRANGCLITPGLINTHHHMFQNLTRSYAPSTKATLFGWLTTLYPLCRA
jgi:cytosine/adenosine deaminase-related metal-dependent hydrolase